MKRVTVMICVVLFLGGCAANQPATPPPPKVALALPPKRETAPPLPTGAEILAAQPSEVRQAVREHETDGKWPTYSTSGSVLYPFGEGVEPVVDCAALPRRTSSFKRVKPSQI